ncbi:MAG: C40 family peptidase [Rickettsiales bacterium]|jgi:cell wall-associated NlpC family hydrolase|nr:C40 family peptidase [Rickettsiales bacterium]
MGEGEKIAAVAERWLGTKFHYAGRVKKNNLNAGGVDCIGLIMKIGEEIGCQSFGKNIILFDYVSYCRYPNRGEMGEFLNRHFVKIEKKQLRAGDIIYFNFKNGLEHAAIYSSEDIIHCSAGSRAVVREKITASWEEKMRGFFRYGNIPNQE